jgi:hypothetical protein
VPPGKEPPTPGGSMVDSEEEMFAEGEQYNQHSSADKQEEKGAHVKLVFPLLTGQLGVEEEWPSNMCGGLMGTNHSCWRGICYLVFVCKGKDGDAFLNKIDVFPIAFLFIDDNFVTCESYIETMTQLIYILKNSRMVNNEVSNL